MNAQAIATNIVKLTFDSELATDKLSRISGQMISDDAPTLNILRATAIDVHSVNVYVSASLQPVIYTISVSGLYASDGTPLSGSAEFEGIVATGPRLAIQDKRLKIDIDTFSVRNGDFGFQAGDDFIREQVFRAMFWDRTIAVKDLARPIDMIRMERRIRKSVMAIPGVVEANVEIQHNQEDEVVIFTKVRTNQTSIELTRIFGGPNV